MPSEDDLFADLPEEIRAGFRPDLESLVVEEATAPHLWELRQAWNRRAPEAIGLPTETYRELIERRKRYAELVGKIKRSEITQISDFITYNLNVRQFAQDFIEQTEDAKFVTYFHKAIRGITILDPTCGSGAFLFAALNILEPLYEACLTRMEQWEAEAPGQHPFFADTLAEIANGQHPNRQYYIYKSIILNNLYGVDLMKEAVEIAKLRLFLKLVATVDLSPRKENFGLEPLPDIDFNIRAGNTLVGFATEQELLETIQKKEALFAQEKLDEFKEDCWMVSQAYAHFQDAQRTNDQGSDSFKQTKAELRERLEKLNAKLNVYLATNYGIDAERKPKQYQAWYDSHQPFHWFAEFYRIVAENGGFDVIVGNPPYVEYSKVRKSYTINEKIFKSSDCGNIYAMVFERSILLSNKFGKISLIIPISLGSTKRMESLLQMIEKSSGEQWASFYAERPSKLFTGAEVLLNIIIIDRKVSNQNKLKHTTGLLKWSSDYRSVLFSSINYVEYDEQIRNYLIPRYLHSIEAHIAKSFFSAPDSIEHKLSATSSQKIYYRIGGGRYWKIFTTFQPKFVVEGVQASSSRESYLFFNSENDLYACLICLSSSTFFWYFQITTNGRDLNPFDIKSFSSYFTSISKDPNTKKLAQTLMIDYKNNKVEKQKVSKQTGHIIYEEFYPRKSKPIIDQIDTLLAQHYGFTEEELDFIINYDIKYRMGKALLGEDDNADVDE